MMPRLFIVTGGSAGIGLWVGGTLCGQGHVVLAIGRRDPKDISKQELLRSYAEGVKDGRLRNLEDDPDGVDIEGITVEQRSELGNLKDSSTFVSVQEWVQMSQMTPSGIVHSSGIVWKGTLADENEEFLVQQFAETVGSLTKGIKAGPKAAGYCTIKSALIQLTKSIAIDFGCDGIRANAICPGDTFVSRWLEEGYYTNEKTPVTLLEASSPIEVPLQRIGRPNDISHLVTFMISGCAIPVDGGGLAGDCV